MLKVFQALGCVTVGLNDHFFYSHLDYYSENLGDSIEEQGQRFRQDIKEMERDTRED